jgi:DNA (cytosine-5)-methyltransferase 1
VTAIYNEIDPFAAAWMRNLIAAGHIAPGVVDERSIEDLTPADVAGPGQRHFFAGIAGWSYALRLAGIPDDADVWTGSCPCQPFSSAGKRGGTSDPRHLWPAWFALIEQCRPPVIFGEQVASIDGLAWLDTVSSDLENAGYSVGAADLCAAGVGAPHIRQRLYFVGVAHGYKDGRALLGPPRVHAQGEPGNDTPRRRAAGCVGDATRGFWEPAEWLWCQDSKWRPVEPGTFPLVDGATARVGRLRGYGNVIVPQVAAAFIRAAQEAMTALRVETGEREP